MINDFRLLMATRALRAFGFGFSAVLIGVHLQGRYLSSTEIGIVLSISLLAASLGGLVSAAASGRFGRRPTLTTTGLLMAVCGLVLSFGVPFWLLALAGLTGMMGIAGTDLGPFLSVEQDLLAQRAPPTSRNRAFGRYSLTGTLAGAAGSLASGTVTDFARSQLFFEVFAVIGILTAVIPLFLSPAVEGERTVRVFAGLRPLAGLFALFSLDALGGGMVVNGVIAYWLHIRFGAMPAVLGPSFAAMSILSGVSQELAGRLADRVGLIVTMVSTQLPSNLLLLLIPLMPAVQVVIGILLFRSALVSMDVPARQAYLVSIVKPSERIGTIAVAGAVRGIAQAAGPVVTGAAIQLAAPSLPFVIAATVKCIYNIGLYAGFRHRFGEHERPRLER